MREPQENRRGRSGAGIAMAGTSYAQKFRQFIIGELSHGTAREIGGKCESCDCCTFQADDPASYRLEHPLHLMVPSFRDGQFHFVARKRIRLALLRMGGCFYAALLREGECVYVTLLREGACLYVTLFRAYLHLRGCGQRLISDVHSHAEPFRQILRQFSCYRRKIGL